MNTTRAVICKAAPKGNIPQACAVCHSNHYFHGAKKRNFAVVVNVYKRGRWDHIEVYHYPRCYDAAGRPFEEILGGREAYGAAPEPEPEPLRVGVGPRPFTIVQ